MPRGDDAAVAGGHSVDVAVLACKVRRAGWGLALQAIKGAGVEIDDFAVGAVVLAATVAEQAVEHIRSDAAPAQPGGGRVQEEDGHDA